MAKMGGVTTVTTIGSSGPRHKRTYCWGRTQDRYERAFDQTYSFKYHWSQGQIAFLKPEDAFSGDEYEALIKPAPGHLHGYLPAKAAGHPVIILSAPSENSTHVLVTPVSAYSSGEGNNFLPPWQQDSHKWKKKNEFRSFYGCERYSPEYPYLYLEDDKSMPKPRASWLYIQSLWAVPLTVIGRFTKTPHLLKVRQDSLDNLLEHMRLKCRRWKECKAEIDAYERAAHGIVDPTPAQQVCWRDASPSPLAAPVPTPATRRPSNYQPHQRHKRVSSTESATSSGRPPENRSPAPSSSPSWASVAAQKRAAANKNTPASAEPVFGTPRHDNKNNQANYPPRTRTRSWGNTNSARQRSWRNVVAGDTPLAPRVAATAGFL